MKYWPIYILLTTFLLTACEREIDFDGEIEKPKLVMHAEVGEGDTIVQCFVSRSSFFLEDMTYNWDEYLMPDAVTQLQRGGQEWQTMTWSDKDKAFILLLATPLKAGETINLRASYPDYETITAQQTVVNKPFMQILPDYWRNPAKHYFGISVILTAYPQDVDVVLGFSAECRYNIYTKKDSQTVVWRGMTTRIMSDDAIFASEGNAYSTEQRYNSRHELFFKPGYEHTKMVELHIPYQYPDEGDDRETEILVAELDMHFHAHSRDSYLYWTSVYAAFGNGGDEDFDLGREVGSMFGTEEEVQIYTNINGGYGMFAATSQYTVNKKNIKF